MLIIAHFTPNEHKLFVNYMIFWCQFSPISAIFFAICGLQVQILRSKPYMFLQMQEICLNLPIWNFFDTKVGYRKNTGSCECSFRHSFALQKKTDVCFDAGHQERICGDIIVLKIEYRDLHPQFPARATASPVCYSFLKQKPGRLRARIGVWV